MSVVCQAAARPSATTPKATSLCGSVDSMCSDDDVGSDMAVPVPPLDQQAIHAANPRFAASFLAHVAGGQKGTVKKGEAMDDRLAFLIGW